MSLISLPHFDAAITKKQKIVIGAVILAFVFQQIIGKNDQNACVIQLILKFLISSSFRYEGSRSRLSNYKLCVRHLQRSDIFRDDITSAVLQQTGISLD